MKLDNRAVTDVLSASGPMKSHDLAEHLGITTHFAAARLRKLAREGVVIETESGVYRAASAEEYIAFVNAMKRRRSWFQNAVKCA